MPEEKFKDFVKKMFGTQKSGCCNIQFEEIKEDTEKPGQTDQKDADLSDNKKTSDRSCGCGCC